MCLLRETDTEWQNATEFCRVAELIGFIGQLTVCVSSYEWIKRLVGSFDTMGMIPH